MEKIIKNKTKHILLLIVGIILGAIVFSALRTIYYIFRDYQPNMHPGMFIIFAPIIGIILSVVALIIEIPLTFSSKIATHSKHSFLIGLSYSTILLILIDKWFIVAFASFNPITVRLFACFRKNKNHITTSST